MFSFLRREPSSRRAEKLVSRGKIEAAIREYRRILEEDPDDTGTLNRVGDLYSRVNKYGEAIDLYRRTAERFVDEGFYVKAIAVYKKIHRLDSNQLDVYEKLARLYGIQGLVKDARTQYEVLADYYEKEGRLDRAVAIAREIVQLEPHDPGHRMRLVELYEREGDAGSVVGEYLEIARVMLAHDRIEKAIQVLERGFERHSLSPDLVVGAVKMLRSADQSAFADELLGRAESAADEVGRAEVFEKILDRLRAAEPAPEEVIAVAAAPPEESPAEPALVEEEDGTLVLEPPDEVVKLSELEEAQPEEAPAAAAVAPSAKEPAHEGTRVEDVLGEAEVFISYGFREKALDRLGEGIREFPDSMAAYEALIRILLEDRSYRAAMEAANKMAVAAGRTGEAASWLRMRERLETEGFLVEGDEVKAPPASLADVSEEIDLLEPRGADLESIIESAREASSAQEAEAPRQPVPLADENAEVDFALVDDEFADLAAEVEKEIEAAAGAPVEAAETPSLEEIVESFKQGVAENLSSEDFDTHFNLGIAYREMGLVDEAIGEFEIAARSDDYFIGCCSLMGLCFRDKGDFEQATSWYRKGLATSDLKSEERLALLYDLADTQEMTGDIDAARTTFGEISAADAGYRDVGDRLTSLG